MTILGSIMTKVLGHAPASPAKASPAAAPSTAPAASASAASPATPSAPAQPTGAIIDVAAVLDGLKTKATQNLDWKNSIVDLLKLLSLDSSLAARKELAKELHYTGDTEDSAKMNIWLHKQVLLNLEANGGKLPGELKNLS